MAVAAPDLLTAWREAEWRRDRVAAALGERYPALYAWWSAVQQEASERAALDGERAVVLARSRSVAGLAHVAGVAPGRVAVWVAAYDALVDDLVAHLLVAEDLAALAVRELAAERLVRALPRSRRRGRGRATGLVVETRGAVCARDGHRALDLNTWDVDRLREVFDAVPVEYPRAGL